MEARREAPAPAKRAPRALPVDFLIRVFDLMEPSQLGVCCLVCTDWNTAISTSVSLWTKVGRRQLALYRLAREEAAVAGAGSLQPGGASRGGSGAAPASGPDRASTMSAAATAAARQPGPSREGPSPSSGNRETERGRAAQRLLDLGGGSFEAQRAGAVDMEHKRRLQQGTVAVRALRGHSGRVNCCRMLMGTVASGSADQSVKLWSAADGHCLSTWRTPSAAPVSDIELDHLKVVAAAGAGIFIWDRATGRLLRRIDKLYTRVRALSYDGDTQLAAACDDGSVRIVDVYSGQSSHIFRPHTAAATCAALEVDSGLLASGGSDGAVQLNDVQSGSKACMLQPRPTEGVTTIHMMLGAHKLMAGTLAGNLYLWDLRNVQGPLKKSKLFPHAITSLHAAPYGPSTIAAAGLAGSLHVLDADTCRPVRTFERPEPRQGWSGRAPARVLEAPQAEPRADSDQLPDLVKPGTQDGDHRPYLVPISCVRLGMGTAVTAHTDNTVSIWQLGLPRSRIS